MAVSPGATAERVADVPRSNGAGAFQVYRYRNPGSQQQPAEYTAFGEDQDEKGRRYGILIVLTATSEGMRALFEICCADTKESASCCFVRT